MISAWEKRDVRDQSPDQLRQRLLDSKVSKLGLVMGTNYMNAVRVCLEGSFVVDSALEEGRERSEALQFSFKQLVVDPLAKCRA